MARIKERIEVTARNPEEYYEILNIYKRDQYTIEESEDVNSLTFIAIRDTRIWEMMR